MSSRETGRKMKIKIIGCYVTWSKENSTSFLIDEKLIFDVPQGSFKDLYNDNDLTKIEYIIISHFHSDHFADLHLIIDILNQMKEHKNISILAPKGCKERLIKMFEIFDVMHLKEYVDDHVTFIDCEDGKEVTLGDYEIKIYKVLHNWHDTYGFVIEKNGKKIGFSSDSAMCDNLLKIIDVSDAIFIDSSNIEKNNKHLCTEEVISLSKEYPSCRFIPVHMTYRSRAAIEQELEIPKEGQEYIF